MGLIDREVPKEAQFDGGQSGSAKERLRKKKRKKSDPKTQLSQVERELMFESTKRSRISSMLQLRKLLHLARKDGDEEEASMYSAELKKIQNQVFQSPCKSHDYDVEED